jgi:hypothetical protein
MKAFFIFVMVVMISVSTWASFDSNVIAGTNYLLRNPWGIATLFDTYFSFFIIYLWMAYKEPSWMKRLIWLVAVFALGTIAVSIFVLHELYSNKSLSFESLLLRNSNRKRVTENGGILL